MRHAAHNRHIHEQHTYSHPSTTMSHVNESRFAYESGNLRYECVMPRSYLIIVSICISAHNKFIVLRLCIVLHMYKCSSRHCHRLICTSADWCALMHMQHNKMYIYDIYIYIHTQHNKFVVCLIYCVS